MSRPAPKFKVGQLARIVGCLSHPQCNGMVVQLIDGPKWFDAGSVRLPSGERIDTPPGWIYRTDEAMKPDWVHELRLAPIGDIDPPATWSQVEQATGWRPARERVTPEELDEATA